MADLLNSQEINDLLNSVISPEEETTQVETRKKTLPKQKIYSNKVYKNNRFSYPYNSPVIKNENIVSNPNPLSVYLLNKVIVRTLDNYVECLKKKN